MWRIEYEPHEHQLEIYLREQVFGRDMRDLARAHARALEATGRTPFRVLVDLRGLHPLDSESSRIFADMKRVAASLPHYRGRAVIVDSPTVAMQQRNLTMEDGGDERELITRDARAAEEFLARQS